MVLRATAPQERALTRRRRPSLVVLALTIAVLVGGTSPRAQVTLRDDTDRAAFRAWFALLADAQFYRTTPDVGDCAALVRHAFREALRPHTPEWLRRIALPRPVVAPDVRGGAVERGGALMLFRVGAGPAPPYAEFADASTIVRLNARRVARTTQALRTGDLLYFRRPGGPMPHHLMVFVGRSPFEPAGDDWVVYHTGPSTEPARRTGAAGPAGTVDPGEVRKVRVADLLRHPDPSWRPVPSNPAFGGVYRLAIL